MKLYFKLSKQKFYHYSKDRDFTQKFTLSTLIWLSWTKLHFSPPILSRIPVMEGSWGYLHDKKPHQNQLIHVDNFYVRSWIQREWWKKCLGNVIYQVFQLQFSWTTILSSVEEEERTVWDFLGNVTQFQGCPVWNPGKRLNFPS